MNKPKSYKTNHPTIKEISIGDKFVLNDGETVTFREYNEYNTKYPFEMNDGMPLSYTKDLKFSDMEEHIKWNIKERYIPLKDKLDLI